RGLFSRSLNLAFYVIKLTAFTYLNRLNKEESMSRINTIIGIFSKIVEKIQYWITISIISFLTILVFIQVILRYFFNSPLPWIQEVSSGLLIWLTFMGAGVLTKRKGHLRVDILVNQFNIFWKRITEKCIDILIFIFSIILIIYSIDFFNSQLPILVGTLQIPKSFHFALPVLIFAISISIYQLEALFKIVKE